MQVARKFTVVKTSHLCASLTCVFVKELTEVGRRRVQRQLTPLFQYVLNRMHLVLCWVLAVGVEGDIVLQTARVFSKWLDENLLE